MSEGYKPSYEEKKKAEGMMDRDQKDESIERQGHVLGSEPISPKESVLERLNRYDADLGRVESAAGLPPEWNGDVEKARKIQSEIRQKLEELDGLFKSQPGD